MSENAQRGNPEQAGDGPTRSRSTEPARRDEGRSSGGAEPDVLLDVPEVSVDSIRLAVDSLDADLSLRARLANLLQLDAGVRVHLQGVELDITGVHAEALLKVRLEKLVEILDRALSTIDRNPQIIEALASTTTDPIDDVNRAAQQLRQQGDQLSATARRIGDGGGTRVRRGETEPAPESQVLGGGSGSGGATEELGQQVGAVGAVADRSLRAGPGGTGQQGAAGPGGGEGAAGAAERTSGRAEEMGGATGPAQAGGGRPEADRGGRTDAGAKEEAQPTPGEGPPSAMQFAEQAGETLRQAGRSVWEAIQSNIAARRDPDR